MKAFVCKELTGAARIENFRVGYDGYLEKRSGTRLLCTFPARLRGAISVGTSEGDLIYAVAGSTLYRLLPGETLSPESIGSLTGAAFSSDSDRVEMFMFAGKLCILAGGEYFVSDGASLERVGGYVPLIAKNINHLGVGESFERLNLLTNQVRARFIADGTTHDYTLNYKIVSVDAVYVAGTLIPASEYTVSIYSSYATLRTSAVYSSPNAEDIVEIFFTLNRTSQRSRVTSCTKAAVYGGDTDSRVFLYGGSEQSTLFPSEPSGADDRQTISYDYFPAGAQMTVGDGNLPVCGAVRQFDRLAVFTGESAFYTYPHDDGLQNGIRRFSFPILPLNSDVGATMLGGAVLVENEPYSLSQSSLYRFKSTSVRDERLAIRVEPPAYLGFDPNTTGEFRLYVNKLRGELWCYRENSIAIYNARRDCWYGFTGIDADYIFSYKGEAAFFKGAELMLFDSSLHSDLGAPFQAVCESGWLDLGSAFEKKTLRSFGVTVGASGSERSLNVSLTADCGIFPASDPSRTAHSLRSASGEFAAPASDSPTVFTSRCRLGRVSHVRLKITAKPDGNPLELREFAIG